MLIRPLTFENFLSSLKRHNASNMFPRNIFASWERGTFITFRRIYFFIFFTLWSYRQWFYFVRISPISDERSTNKATVRLCIYKQWKQGAAQNKPCYWGEKNHSLGNFLLNGFMRMFDQTVESKTKRWISTNGSSYRRFPSTTGEKNKQKS